jgi:hypothetical protein
LPIVEFTYAKINIESPLLKQGQSIHHVCATHADSIMLDQKTIYNYVQYGLLSAEIMDLPRKVSYRPRKKNPEVN